MSYSALFNTISSNTPYANMSCFMIFHHYFIAQSLCLLPSILIYRTLTCTVLRTVLYPTKLSTSTLPHFFPFMRVTLSMSQTYTFLKRSFLHTPLIHVNIHISVEQIICSRYWNLLRQFQPVFKIKFRNLAYNTWICHTLPWKLNSNFQETKNKQKKSSNFLLKLHRKLMLRKERHVMVTLFFEVLNTSERLS